MNISPKINSTPFANITRDSYYGEQEEEVLFSMHSVFRIGEVQRIGDQGRVFEVHLTMTGDDDLELRLLTDRIGEEVDRWNWMATIGLLYLFN